MPKNPYIRGGAALLYIATIVLSMHATSQWASPPPEIVIGMFMLGLLVMSVAIMAYLFFSEPLRLYFSGNSNDAVSFFGKTLGTFVLGVVLSEANFKTMQSRISQ